MQKALRRLGAVGLIREDRGDMLRLHRLIAAFVRLRAYTVDDGAATQGQEGDAAAVADALIASTAEVSASKYPLAGIAYLPHLRQVLAELDTATGQMLKLAQLSVSLATLLSDQGDYAGARPLFERALEIFERVLGPDHPHTRLVHESLKSLALRNRRI